MAIVAGNIIVGEQTQTQGDSPQRETRQREVVIVEKPVLQENGTVIVDGRPKKFNKISRYMIDMLTTEE